MVNYNKKEPMKADTRKGFVYKMNTKKEELIELIKRAQGNRSLRKYAEDAGVSYSSIYRIRKGDYIPSLQTLQKLSSTKAKPQGGVSLEELMTAAGYRDEKADSLAVAEAAIGIQDMDSNQGRQYQRIIHYYDQATLPLPPHELTRKATGLFLSALAEKGVEFSMTTDRDTRARRWDVAVDIALGNVNRWFVDFFIYLKDVMVPIRTKTALGNIMLEAGISRCTKVSLAVNTKAAYEYLLRYKDRIPYRGELSVIYIDLEKYEIVAETYLSHFYESDPSAEFYII